MKKHWKYVFTLGIATGSLWGHSPIVDSEIDDKVMSIAMNPSIESIALNDTPRLPHKKDDRASCFPLTGEWSLAFDSFRNSSDGSWEGNMGAFTSLNLKARMVGDWFAGLGGSYGLYDWAGRASMPFSNEKAFQQQGFLSGSIALAGTKTPGVHVGISYDWMFNRHFGLFAVNPMMSQVRGQIGYLFSGGNEWGAWGTIDTLTSHQEVSYVPLKFRAIPQANLFWCHYFKNKGYGMVWAGTPYRRGLMYDSGRPGRYIFGARFSAPLTGSLSISGHGSYMGARSSSLQGVESKNYSANVSFALTYAFGPCRGGATPYLTVADNSSFLVDTNSNH